jgi:alpha-mannosidase
LASRGRISGGVSTVNKPTVRPPPQNEAAKKTVRARFRRAAELSLVIVAFAIACPGGAAADPKRVFMAPDDHTDYYWSGTADQYSIAFTEMLDYYLDQADATKNEPANFQSRFSADGSLWLWEYAKNKNVADFQRLVDRLKDGHISAPLNPLVITYGGVPAEGVIRSMYYPGQLERRYGLDFPLAIAMENSGMPYGLGAVWAGAGAEYSWKGVCNCPSLIPNLHSRAREIYNWIGPDGSRILMKWNSLHVGNDNESIGGYAEARRPATALDLVTTNASTNGFAARYPYNTIGVFGQGWDDFSTKNLLVQQTCKAKTDNTRTCIVSDSIDFFREFDTLYGQVIPTVAASFGNEWDLSPASMAEVSARVKRSLEALRSAEALATLVALRDPTFLDGRDVARDRAYLNFGLFFEHDFENGGPSVAGPLRIAWQRQVATEIETYANALAADASAALGALIQKSGTNPRFFLFNSLSWKRTDIADIPYTGALPVHVVDLTTGLEIPSQVVGAGASQALRVQAPDIPSVGYKVFEIQPGAGQSFASSPTANAGTGAMENEYYRLTVSPRGAVTSFVDKRIGNREFAGTTGGFGLNDLGSATGSLALENAGPVSVTLRATSSSPLAHTSRITLTRGSDRVAIQNEITQSFGGTREWRFSFNEPNPEVRHEEVGAVLLAKLTSQGGSYSPTNARYDYLTLNHFADMSGSDGTGVTLSNADAYFMRIGNSSVSTLDTATPQLSVLAGGSLRPANPILNQAGDSYLRQRFALQSHGPYDQPRAMRFALEHQNPLVGGMVTGGSAYPGNTYSYLTISNPDVLLWSLKPAEEGIGEGVMARLWNLTPTPKSFAISLNEPIARAKSVTHIETDRGDATISAGTVTATAAQNQLLSFRLFPSSLSRSVKLLPTDTRATEAGDGGSFTVVRTGDLSQPLDVPYTVSGAATPGSDYEALPGTVRIPAGANSAAITLRPLADTVAESLESITVTLTPQPGYLLAQWRSATALIVASTGEAPPPGATGLYPFSEGTGSGTADISGNGNNGSVVGATWVAGKYGQGLQFNGSTSYVTIPDAGSLDIGSTGTIEAWVNLAAVNRWHGIVAKGSANADAAHNYALEVNNGNRVVCAIGNGASASSVGSSATLAAGTLYHLACVWTGTQLQVYINGVLNATAVQTLTPLGNISPLYIGQFGGGSDRTSGLIDEVRVSNQARTQAQIQSDMNAPISSPGPSASDTTKPTVTVTSPSTAAQVSGTVAVTADASDNVGVAGVQFTVDGSNLGAEDTVAPYSVSWDTRTSPNGSHNLSAVARDAAGNRQTASTVMVSVSNDTTAPTVPTNLTAAASSSSQINLSWSAATDNVAVAGYRVSRNGSVIATTSATTFNDTGLAPQTTYTYSVAAFDAAGNASAGSASASATTAAGTPPPPPPTTGVVAAYRFGEGIGTATADSSGNGNGGTLVNGPTWVTAGKYGGAINFDGVNDYVRVADGASLDLGRTGTVEAWVKLDTLNRWQSVLAKGSANADPSHNYAIELNSANRWNCILGNGTSSFTIQSPSAPASNQYYHVACVWDGTTAKLYIDGNLSASSTQLVTPAGNAAPLTIGQFGGDADRLDGVIDEVRIYGRALSQAEIRSDMSTPLP